jgi:WD40 repeat protein
MSSDSD